MTVTFEPVESCWICGSGNLQPYHEESVRLGSYAEQDPELSAYTGSCFFLQRCANCGFGQPDRLPTLERYFDRMYNIQWSDQWMEDEFNSTQKDFIFRTILSELGKRVPPPRRSLLDVGAHLGRFIRKALDDGWLAEGVEVNPRTAAVAARKTGAPIHRENILAFPRDRQYGAVTLTDVLEHLPRPMATLSALGRLVEPGGWIAVKVPAGQNQLLKETLRSGLRRRAARVATNFGHVNQFSVRSLRTAIERAGFVDVEVRIGCPELFEKKTLRLRASNAVRMAVYRGGSALPGGVHTPLALNLQAYARRP